MHVEGGEARSGGPDFGKAQPDLVPHLRERITSH
jgi:hypothetical protein